MLSNVNKYLIIINGSFCPDVDQTSALSLVSTWSSRSPGSILR